MRRYFSLCIVLALAAGARAQTLADRVPADAVAYVGWKGADAPGNGYAGSHLQAVIDSSKFAQVRDEVLPQLMQKITAESKDHGEGALVAKTTLNILWRHPSAAFFSGMTTDANGKPTPKLGVICQAGTDSDALMTIFNAGVHGPDAAPMARAFVAGDCTVFLIGYDNEAVIPAAGDYDKSLKNGPDFKRLVSTTGHDALVDIYVDATKAMAQIDAAVNLNADEQAKTIWPKARDASGLTGVKRYYLSAGFDGKDWQSQSFVDAPAPRTGLLTVVEPAAINPALLSRVPITATSSMLGQLNFGELLRQVRSIAAAVDPQAGDMFDKGMGVAQMMVGRNLQKDILDPLGSQWAIYSDPSIPSAQITATNSPLGESSIGNAIVVNKLLDPAKAVQGWTMLSYAISNGSAGVIRAKHLPITMSMTKNGEQSVFTIVTPYGQPSWTVKDGFMYFGLSADGVVAAANKASGPPATEQPLFAPLAKQLATDGTFSGFQFTNLPETVAGSYPRLEASVQKLSELLKQQSITLPENILPPLDKLKAELTPAASVSWADAAGWHSKSRSPLPGVAADPSLVAVGSGALGVSILLPSLNRARETANRIKCASNQRQIGQGMLLYANDHQGKYPALFSELLLNEELTADVFLCPSSDTSLPKNKDQMTPADLAAWVDQHSDYVYCGKGLTVSTSGRDDIVVYEKPDDHHRDGMNILFGDGHVEFLLMKDAVARIKAQNKTVPNVALPDVEPAAVP